MACSNVLVYNNVLNVYRFRCGSNSTTECRARCCSDCSYLLAYAHQYGKDIEYVIYLTVKYLSFFQFHILGISDVGSTTLSANCTWISVLPKTGQQKTVYGLVTNEDTCIQVFRYTRQRVRIHFEYMYMWGKDRHGR